MKNLEIVKMITLSTAHITETTANLLTNNPETIDLSIYNKGEYGWFIYINSDEIEEIDNNKTIPDDLKAVIRFAYGVECTWLCLDRDGTTTTGLMTYNW